MVATESLQRAGKELRSVSIADMPPALQRGIQKQEVPAIPIGEGFLRKLSGKINTPAPAILAKDREDGAAGGIER